MSLYAIKNDKGEWLRFSADSVAQWNGYADTWTKRDSAQRIAGVYSAHVVELTEKQALEVVSAEEAEMLEQAKYDDDPAELIVGFVNSSDNYDDDRKAEERLMRAYVNGYTVAKEKKYLLPMDGTLEENDGYNNYQLYAYCYKGRWITDEIETDPAYKHFTVTQNELETAPAWVKAIKPVEVTDDAD